MFFTLGQSDLEGAAYMVNELEEEKMGTEAAFGIGDGDSRVPER